MIDKFNFAKINSQSSQSSKTALPSNQTSCTAYAVNISECKVLCSCNECTSIGQNNSFSHEAFGVLSDQIEQITDLIKTGSRFLAVTCPDEIKQYNQTLDNLKCADAKNKLSFLFFQFVIWTLNKNKFTFEASQNDITSVKISK